MSEGLTIVIPAFDEAGSLERAVAAALSQQARIGRELEIIVVDDGSTDGTAELADELMARLPIRVVHHLRNRGSGQAILTGARRARMPLVMYAPADGQFHWDDLPALLESARDADIVMGTRSERPDYSTRRRVQSAVYAWLVRRLFGLPYRDVNWVHLWRRSVFEGVRLRSRGVFFLVEVLLAALDRGMRVSQVPATYAARRDGTAKGSRPGVILLTVAEMLRTWLSRRCERRYPFEPAASAALAPILAHRFEQRAAPGALGTRSPASVAEALYYDSLHPLRLDGSLAPRWLERRGELRVSLDGAIEALPRTDEVLAWVGRWPAIVRTGDGRARFAFDPARAAAGYLLEAFASSRRPLASWLPASYLAMPGGVRLALHAAWTRLTASGRTGAEWSLDPPVDALATVCASLPGWIGPAGEPAVPKSAEGRHVSTGPAWPEGRRWAVSVTLDADTVAGLDRAPGLVRLAQDYGHRATVFVTGDAARRRPSILQELLELGAELALHGDRHDYALGFLATDEIERRLERCRDLTESYRMRGFRAPGLLLTSPGRRALARRFLYDSSIPDADIGSLQAPERGCGTVFPFAHPDGVLELPVSLPLEDRLMTLGLEGEALLSAWEAKARQVRAIGGLLVVTTHAEPHLGGSPRFADVYRRLLEQLETLGDAWYAPCGEVARRWADAGGSQ